MIAALSTQLGVALAPAESNWGNAYRVEVDGASDELDVVCEAWAHQGAAKGGQVHKILRDALKLALVNRVLELAKLILLFSDNAATGKFRTGWAALALREFENEIRVVDLSPDMRRSVVTAQERQRR